MNPLGWKSAIYTLARVGEQRAPAMLDTAEQVVGSVNRTFALSGKMSTTERAIHGIGSARDAFTNAITDGMNGLDDLALATRFDDVAARLKPAARGSSLGAITGNAQEAQRAAVEVGAALRHGGGPGAAAGVMPEATHMQIWSLRNALDQAMTGIGTAHVMGGLR